VLNTFVDITMQGLTRAEALVWLALFLDTKPDGLTRTGQADLARRAGVNLSTVKRAVAVLVKARLLTVVYRGGLRRGPSVYRVRPLTRELLTPTSSSPMR
jgi:DNA-binding MarR family transcriptional regulator